jgi:hypothetical protein
MRRMDIGHLLDGTVVPTEVSNIIALTHAQERMSNVQKAYALLSPFVHGVRGLGSPLPVSEVVSSWG